MNYYIFASDPHGTGQPWIDKVENALKLYPTAQIVFGGDYIDGRKYSRETVNYVRSKQSEGHIALLGNHEQLMLNAVMDVQPELWKINGSKTTIKSFCGRSWGNEQAARMFAYYNKDVIAWARALPDIYVTDNIVFVHAGLDFSKENPIKDTSHTDKIWIRDDYIYSMPLVFAHNKIDKTIVTGHTPTVYVIGKFENNLNQEIYNVPESCPVISVHYPGEHPRIFTDGGCHSSLPNNTGNVVVLNSDGNLEKVIF